MEDYKIDIWKKDKINLEYELLNDLQIHQILHKIARLCNISIESINYSSIFFKMEETLNKKFVLLNINEKEGFRDLCLFLKLNIHQDSTVFVVWNYNDIDKISVSLLLNYWDYIWYGTSDEICLLYFSDIELLVMINDYGTIQIFP